MFKAASDRLNYGNLLTPPGGYHLDKAIGTTYSLDLETLTAICISLGLIEETDSEVVSNPISMLNALQKVSDKIVVFCEAGQIKMPSKPSPLCVLLEKMVVEMCLPFDKKIGRFPAFHPKTWTLSYVNDNGDRRYRFVTLSRNLTFDRSWDVSVSLDGKPAGYSAKTQPIIDFVEFLRDKGLSNSLDKGRQKKLLASMMKELENVTFETDSKVFHDFKIQPIGIGDKAVNMNKDRLFADTFHEIIIMSPFLTDSVIKSFNSRERGLTNACRTLITRRSELAKLNSHDASFFDIYCLRDSIIDGEENMSDENTDYQKQDIHAKLYLYRKHRDTSLYLGSMNASYAAINSNVEMMVRLSAKNRYLNGSFFLNDIFDGEADGKNNPFEKVSLENILEEETSSESDKLEQIVKNVCRMSGKGYVTANGDKYDLKLEFPRFRDIADAEVYISPLQSNKTASLDSVVTISELDEVQVSQFYRLAVKGSDVSLERIIIIPTIGMPDNRENLVVKSIVSDRKSFIEYVAFALGDDYLLSLMESRQLEKSGVYKGRESNMIPAVYEKMLKASLECPEKLGEINYLMKMIDDEEIITREFRDMYDTFVKTLKLK